MTGKTRGPLQSNRNSPLRYPSNFLPIQPSDIQHRKNPTPRLIVREEFLHLTQKLIFLQPVNINRLSKNLHVTDTGKSSG